MDEIEVITEDDVDELNRQALNRSSAIARLAGSALLVVGAITLLAWVWLVAKQQFDIDEYGLGFDPSADDGPSLGDRLTLFSTTVTLLALGSIAVVFGFLVRMVADFGQLRAGGSITGAVVGQEIPYEDIDLDDE